MLFMFFFSGRTFSSNKLNDTTKNKVVCLKWCIQNSPRRTWLVPVLPGSWFSFRKTGYPVRGRNEVEDNNGKDVDILRITSPGTPDRAMIPQERVFVRTFDSNISEIKKTRFIWILKSLLSENMSWVIPWPIILSIWLRVTWWYESIKVIFHD